MKAIVSIVALLLCPVVVQAQWGYYDPYPQSYYTPMMNYGYEPYAPNPWLYQPAYRPSYRYHYSYSPWGYHYDYQWSR